ncbi:MAG: DNA-formamidopyrimidine glycosylase family protein [Acidobacteriota bacterium]
MPELPDISLYIECLKPRILNQRLKRIRLSSPFLLRSVSPPLSELDGKLVCALRRLGKRIVLGLEEDYFLILHLMIAGRLRWLAPGSKLPARIGLAAFEFATGTLAVTEAGSKRRASLHLVKGESCLQLHDPGGLEVLNARFIDFQVALQRENHTLKRALTDPRLFSGIGNAYSDEILFHARLSPLQLTQRLSHAEAQRLFDSVRDTLCSWTTRLIRDTGTRFPEKVTAFREGMSVHGRYGRPCTACGTLVQRIVYAENECNYCPRCQTGGRLLADRAFSRLLKDDWPRTVEELENRFSRGRDRRSQD